GKRDSETSRSGNARTPVVTARSERWMVSRVERGAVVPLVGLPDVASVVGPVRNDTGASAFAVGAPFEGVAGPDQVGAVRKGLGRYGGAAVDAPVLVVGVGFEQIVFDGDVGDGRVVAEEGKIRSAAAAARCGIGQPA